MHHGSASACDAWARVDAVRGPFVLRYEEASVSEPVERMVAREPDAGVGGLVKGAEPADLLHDDIDARRSLTVEFDVAAEIFELGAPPRIVVEQQQATSLWTLVLDENDRFPWSTRVLTRWHRRTWTVPVRAEMERVPASFEQGTYRRRR